MSRAISSIGPFLLGFFIFFAFPYSAFAAATFTWTPFTIDSETGSRVFGTPVVIQENTTATVQLNTTGVGRVSSSPSAPNYAAELYLIHPETGERQLVTTFHRARFAFDYAWTAAGIYELDVYRSGTIIEVRGPVERFLSWMFGETAYAAFTPQDLLDTIHFTILAEDEAEACCSSVVFLPGFAGSRLHTLENGEVRDLWEPSSKSDLRLLALNPDGSSQVPIFVGEIVDSYFGIPLTPKVYQELIEYFDSLVEEDSISDWRSFPYDWRHDAFSVVDLGTLRQDGSRDYLIPLIEEMALESKTGKVTLVTHSNGGLVAKALMVRLEATAKENLVDRLIMVAAPQIGTPQGLVGLLHGKDFLPWYLTLDATVRTVASTFPGAYGLVPSSAYYSELSTSTARFRAGSVTATYSNQYGEFIDLITEQFSFLQNNPVTRLNPGESDLITPISLSPTILATAGAIHDVLDAWSAPEGVSVHEIAGWGNPTTHRLEYTTINTFKCPTGLLSCGYYESLDFEPIKQEDGDGTVVTGSALRGEERKYFNLARLFEVQISPEVRDHENVVGSPRLHIYIGELLGLEVSHDVALFSEDRPVQNNEEIIVSVHSPLLLEVDDTAGNKSGVFARSIGDLHYKLETIPRSSVYFGGEGKYISLPKEGVYSVIAKGNGTGLFDLRIRTAGGALLKEFVKLPVQPNTLATLTVNDGVVSNLSLDTDGNGTVDMEIDKNLSRDQALQYCKETVGKVQTKIVRLVLLAKIEILKNLTGDKARFVKIAKEILTYIVQKATKDISPERALALATCITALENSK